jgi:hypothetical protein
MASGNGAMNWRLEESCKIESLDVNGTRIWRVEILELAVQRLAIGLCLLWNSLVSSLELVDQANRLSLRISTSKQTNHHSATVIWGENTASVRLSATELEAVMFFSLRAVRDGVAEVDHLDIEAAPEQASSDQVVSY